MTLTPWGRKFARLLHILSGVAWIGADLALLILSATGLLTGDAELAMTCYQAIAVFAPPVLIVLSLSSLATGLILGLGTGWGLVRYWWVAVKLVLNLIMTVLVFVLLVPKITEAAAISVSTEDSRSALGALAYQLVAAPTVSTLLLVFAAVLAVFKPWGKIRPGGQPSGSAS